MVVLSLLTIGLVLQAGTQRLGMAMSVPEGAGEEQYIAALRIQVRLGLDGGGTTIKWDEYEQQQGKPLNDFNGVVKLTNQQTLATISTIDTIKRRLPSDVQDLRWSDEKLKTRFDAFLREAVPKLDKRVKWISLGNEVNAYLEQHPDELDAYLGFLAHSKSVIKGLRSDVQVGVTVTCMDGIRIPAMAKRLTEGMDIAVFTYYPMDGLNVAETSAVAGHFDFMAGVAGNKPLLLQEIGYPSSPDCGSSEEKQAAFVKAVFVQLDRFRQRIPLALYFIQSDFGPSLMKLMESYYGISDPKFLTFLRTLGLTDDKGKPKQAWKVFVAEVTNRKPID